MDYAGFWHSYNGLKQTRFILEIMLLPTVVANVVLAITLFSHRDAVRLVPPHLNDEVKIISGKSTESYTRAWGLFLAELIGNISPRNIEFVQKSLEPMISPGVYRQITDILNVQSQQIMVDHISITFEPKSVTYEKETNLVFVTGQSQIKGPTGTPRIFLRTYEFEITMDGFRPMLKWIEMYEGNPRDKKERERLKERNKKESKKDAERFR